MAMGIFVNKIQKKTILIVEMQSSTVRGYLIDDQYSGKPKIILYRLEKEIIYKDHSGTNKYIDDLLNTTKEIIDASNKQLHDMVMNNPDQKISSKISEIHFAMSSPWILSQSKRVSASFNADTKITHKVIKDILDEQRRSIVEDNANPITIVEEKVLDVKLNGYSISSWPNQKTRELEISYILSVSGTDLIQQIINKCKQIVPEEHIVFHASIVLQHIGIKNIFREISSYLLIHIHGEITDIGIIKNDACLFFGSFPTGMRTIIENIQKETSIDYHTADSLLALYENHTLDMSDKNNTDRIRKISENWLEEFKNLLKDSNINVNLFKNILLSSDTHVHFLVDTISSAFPNGIIETFDLSALLPIAIHNVHNK